MLFNLFKKKKDDELNIGGQTIKTSSNVGSSMPKPTPRPAPQQFSQYQPSQSSTKMAADRLMAGQNIATGINRQPQGKIETPSFSMDRSKTMQQNIGDTLSRKASPENQRQQLQNYKPQQRQTLPPVPQQQPQGNNYLQTYQNLAGDRNKLLAEQKAQAEDYYNKAYGEKNRFLGEYIPQLQQQFAQAKGGIAERQALARQETDMAKSQAVDEWGTSQRQAAETRRESEARTAGRFADLNTTDSYGYGSHGQAQENIESDFNRFTQEGLRQREQNMFQIDKSLQDYNLQAKQQIDEMEMGLNNAIMQIQSDMRMNDIEKESAVRQVMQQYQSGVQDVQEWLQTNTIQLEQQMAALQKDQLSREFMASGVPQTETDYRYLMSNYDTYKELLGGDGGAEKQDLLNLVDQALTTDLGAMSGVWGATGLGTKFGSGLETKALIDQIKNKLTVEARNKLKGQGQISDAETLMLERSLSKLQPGMEEAALKRELTEIRNVLTGQNRYVGQERPSLQSLIE
jgi:hypothetical protein